MIGDGPPLLLIHGFGISFNIWQNLIPHLRDDFSLVMIELPGIGTSPACTGDYLQDCTAEIERLRTDLRIERWHLLSYSSGTRVGERYVREHADRVISAVYLCPAQLSSFKAFNLKIAKLVDVRFPRFGDWVLSGRRLDFLIRLLGFNLRPSPHAIHWMDEISSRSAETLKQIIHSLPQNGGRRFLMPPVPHLFIWGTRDLITASPGKPSARHRLIDAAHSAPVTEPEQVAELVVPFLSSIR